MSSGLYFGTGVARGIQSSLDRLLQLKLMREERAAREREAGTQREFVSGERRAGEAHDTAMAQQRADLERQAAAESQSAQIASENRGAMLRYGFTPGMADESAGPSVMAGGEAERRIAGAPETLLAKAGSELDFQSKKRAAQFEYGLGSEERQFTHGLENAKLYAGFLQEASRLAGAAVANMGPQDIKLFLAEQGAADLSGYITRLTGDFMRQAGMGDRVTTPVTTPEMTWKMALTRFPGFTDAAEARVNLQAALNDARDRGYNVPPNDLKIVEKEFRKKFKEPFMVATSGPETNDTRFASLNRESAALGTRIGELRQNLADIVTIRQEQDPIQRTEKMHAEGYDTEDSMEIARQEIENELSYSEAQLRGLETKKDVQLWFRGMAESGKKIESSISGGMAGLGIGPEYSIAKTALATFPAMVPPQARPQSRTQPQRLVAKIGAGNAKAGAVAKLKPAEPGFGQPRRQAAPAPPQATAPIAAAAQARSTAPPDTMGFGNLRSVQEQLRQVDAQLAAYQARREQPPAELLQKRASLQAIMDRYGTF